MGTRRNLQSLTNEVSNEDFKLASAGAVSSSGRTLRVRTKRLKVMSETDDEDKEDEAYFAKQVSYSTFDLKHITFQHNSTFISRLTL